MINTLLFFSLVLVLGVTKAVVDSLSFRRKEYGQSNIFPQSWQIESSWRNKWKNGDPKQGERFWGSSRWLVPITDAFHFAGLINHLIIFALIGLFHNIEIVFWWEWIVYLAGGYILSRTFFHIFYTYIFVTKQK